MSVNVEERIREVAVRQHGVVTRSQLREAGLTDRAVSRRVATGRLTPLHRAVYRVGPLVAQYTREMAAVLACGAGARASYRSAAWLLELRGWPGGASPVEVSIPGNRLVRRAGIRVCRVGHLEDGDTGEVSMVQGIPVTSPGRTLVDLAGVLPIGELERAVARAERSGRLTLEDVERLVARYRGRPGVGALAIVIRREGGPAFTRSEFERRFVAAVRLYGLPMPRFNFVIAGYEVDCWFEAAGLVVELDGRAYHRSWRNQANDRRRDRDLAARGIQVIRITWDDFTREPQKTMRGLIEVLTLRAARHTAIAGVSGTMLATP